MAKILKWRLNMLEGPDGRGQAVGSWMTAQMPDRQKVFRMMEKFFLVLATR